MASRRDRKTPRQQPTDRRMTQSGSPQDRRMRRVEEARNMGGRRVGFVLVGVALLLIIGGIAGWGFYREFVAPNRVLAARVGDTRYTQGDLVKRMRMLQAASSAQGQPFDFGRIPFEVLIEMTEAELIRRFAAEHDVHVTKEDIDFGLAVRFSPLPPEGQDVAEGQLEREYRENYTRFLEESHLSDGDYRRIVEEQIYRVLLRDRLGEQVPAITNQVEVSWIKLPSNPETPIGGIPGAPSAPGPDEIRKTLDEADFAAVASRHNTDRRFSDQAGYVGLVPEGAFRELDKYLFGDEEAGPLAVDEVSRPIYGADGVYIVKVSGAPRQAEVSDVMRERLKDRVLDDWLLEQRQLGASEGWLEINFSSELYEWANEQVRQARPPATPPSGS